MTNFNSVAIQPECDDEETKGIMLVVPSVEMTDEEISELAMQVAADVLKNAGRFPQMAEIEVGTEPDDNPHNRDRIVALIAPILKAAGIKHPVVSLDVTETLKAEGAVDNFLNRIGQMIADEFGGEVTIEEVTDQLTQEQMDAIARDVSEEGKKRMSAAQRNCGCAVCELRRIAFNEPTPEEWTPGRSPEECDAMLGEADWRELDQLHATMVKMKRVPAESLPPSQRRGPNAKLN